MDLNLNLVETGSLVMTVFTTAFTLQVTITIARATENRMKSGIVFYCLKDPSLLLLILFPVCRMTNGIT
jgi:hypothetical protein